MKWEIAGRWSTQLVARRCDTKRELSADTKVNATDPLSSSKSPDSEPYLLLWRNSDKPKTPFNLTPYVLHSLLY